MDGNENRYNVAYLQDVFIKWDLKLNIMGLDLNQAVSANLGLGRRLSLWVFRKRRSCPNVLSKTFVKARATSNTSLKEEALLLERSSLRYKTEEEEAKKREKYRSSLRRALENDQLQSGILSEQRRSPPQHPPALRDCCPPQRRP